MIIIDMDKESFIKEDIAIALGNFDGLHIAHQSLILAMVKKAKEKGLKSSLLLFENHTSELVEYHNRPKLLMSNEDKYKILEELGVDIIYKLKFSEEIMKLRPEEFISDFLIERLNVKSITVGFDYRFGYKASGSSQDLERIASKYTIDVNLLEPISRGEIVSSTRIREYLLNGDILKANEMLGRKYSIQGKVVPGEKRGRKLGFPTANVLIDEKYLLPKEGIYSTVVYINESPYLSGTNIGKNLTFHGDLIKIESFLLDFNEDIYGETIRIEFNEFIRSEIKFSTSKELVEQIGKDIAYIKSV